MKKLECAGYREAEEAVERYLKRYPDKVVEVYIQGKLAYRASVGGPPTPKARF